MKFSEKWIKEFVSINKNSKEIAEQLCSLGIEVPSITPVAGTFSGVVVGHVVECEKHPEADRLYVCKVDINQAELLNIVCGAPNVCKEIKVPVALIGAELSDGFKIKKAKLRNIESCGMLCSAKELGLSEESAGLLELPADAPIGCDFREYYHLEDNSIEIELTPNRGDCASVLGVARELSAINEVSLKKQEILPVANKINDVVNVTFEDPVGCPRYLGRVIKGINAKAKTPIEISEKLRRSGIRSISPVVDITNYVLLELGQPLHAFDLQKIHGSIHVRFAKNSEELQVLSGETIRLESDSLVIADDDQPIALAGVIGGMSTCVDSKTQDIFIECAYFNPEIIAGKSRKYGFNTDSSFRFERGVDYQVQNIAIERTTQLILSIAGGMPGPVCETIDKAFLPCAKNIDFDPRVVEKLLGYHVPFSKINSILTYLGFSCDVLNENHWEICLPSWRFDIGYMADLVEEVGRVNGYHNIPTTQYKANISVENINEFYDKLSVVRNMIKCLGYHEIISYSFVNEDLQRSLEPNFDMIRLQNPMSQDMAVMRTSLFTGLISTLQYNQNRQQDRIRLFETGRVFKKIGDKCSQEIMFGGLAFGDVFREQWGQKSSVVGFYDVKNDLIALLCGFGNKEEYEFKKSTHNALHPGKSADIFRNGKFIGVIGELHPRLMNELHINKKTMLFEISLDVLTGFSRQIKFKEISKFPSVRRDLSFIVKKSISFDEIKECIVKSSNELLISLNIFDIYEGENIHHSEKSIAIGLIFQNMERTLKDDDIESLVKNIITNMHISFGAYLREN